MSSETPYPRRLPKVGLADVGTPVDDERSCVDVWLWRPARLAVIGLFATTMVSMGSDASGQDDLAQRTEDGDAVVLDPITVEARRREERLIDVPIAVTVVDEFQIEEQRIRDIEDLARQVRSFELTTFGDDPRSGLPVIRGVGALSSVLTPNNNTVPTIVDGAPLPGFAATLQLLDAAQIDVLRGPQGTFFGRNSIGGAVNVTSVRPSNSLERSLTAEIGTEWYRSATARISGPLTDNLAGRLALRYQGQEDYLANDQPAQSDLGAFDVAAAAGQLHWDRSEATEVSLSARYEFDQRDTGFAVRLRDSDVFQTEPFFSRNLALATLNVTRQLDQFAVHSVTNFTYYDIDIDSDATDGILFNRLLGLPPEAFIPEEDFTRTDERELQAYQEFRASSLPEVDLSWVVGGVVSYNHFSEQTLGVSTVFPSTNGDRDVDLATQSYSIFGDISVPVFDRWELGGGLRYTYEVIDFDHTYVGNGAPGTVDFFEQSDDRRFNLVAGRVSLGFEPADDSLLYASVSRGAKSGGFPRFTNNAAFGIPEASFGATTNLAYELGAKADVLDGRVSLATALFFNDVENEAIGVFDPATFTFPIENLDIETYGVEAEVSVRLPHGFDLAGGVTFTEGEITGVPAGSATGAEVGNPVPNVPRVSGSVLLSYRGAPDFLGLASDQDLNAFVGYSYTGSRPADVSDSFDLDAQHIIDARVGVTLGSVDVYAFGENLLGDVLEQQGVAIGPGVFSVLPARGRTVGVGVGLQF